MSLLLLLLATGTLLLLGTSAGVYLQLQKPATKGVGWCLARRRPTDPADLPAQAEELTLELANGTSTKGWKIAGQAMDSPGCVVCHGHSASRHHALTLADVLRASFCWVVIFDQRGHGHADGTRCSLGIHEPDDVAAVIEQATQPGEPVVLMGYSMGSRIALRAASLPTIKTRLRGLILEGYFRAWWQPAGGVLRERRLPAVVIVPMLRLMSRCVGRFHRADVFEPVDVPTLLIHGCQDALCPLPGARWLRERLPNAELVEIDGGHSDLCVIDPAGYREALRRFVARLRQPSRDATSHPSRNTEHATPPAP